MSGGAERPGFFDPPFAIEPFVQGPADPVIGEGNSLIARRIENRRTHGFDLSREFTYKQIVACGRPFT
jgi:hypothetical protein